MNDFKRSMKSNLLLRLEEKLYTQPENKKFRDDFRNEFLSCVKGYSADYFIRDLELIDYDPIIYNFPNFSYQSRVFRNSAKNNNKNGKYFVQIGAADIFGAVVSRPFSFGLQQFFGLECLNISAGGWGLPVIHKIILELKDIISHAEFLIISITSLRSFPPLENIELKWGRFMKHPDSGEEVLVQNFLDSLYQKDKKQYLQTIENVEIRSLRTYKELCNIVECPVYFVLMPNKEIPLKREDLTPKNFNKYPHGINWEYLSRIQEICDKTIIPDVLSGDSYAIDAR